MDIIIPEIVKKRDDLYLLGCFDIHDMFIDQYEYSFHNVFVQPIKVVMNRKVGLTYHSFCEVKQRGMKNEMNVAYRNSYTERHVYSVNGARMQVRNVFLNIKRKDLHQDGTIKRNK